MNLKTGPKPVKEREGNQIHQPLAENKKGSYLSLRFSCEDWDRTSDLRVMSPTSYRCSTSQCKSKVLRGCCQIIYICCTIIFMKQYAVIVLSLLAVVLGAGCKKKIKQQEDEVYSRHLQRQVKLTIISTPMPDDKSTMNLLLLNDGQDIEKLGVKKIVDSLYSKKLIQPLIVVGIHAGNREKEYGVSNEPDFMNRGDKADKYAAFIDDELCPFVKKQASLRKFKTVVMAGSSLGGLSAFDIAWDHADKIDKVGVFSGSFWWRDKDDKAPDYSDDKDRIIINKIHSSRKKPHLKYWFYAGGKEETSDRDKDGIIDVEDDTKDLAELIKSKNVCLPEDIMYTEDVNGIHDYSSWRQQIPAFLLWAFAK